MSDYFRNLPVITYNGILSLNINTRAAIYDSLIQNINNFYPYTIQDGQRADIVAKIAYGDPTLDWLIYLVNNIIDPYYDWPLSNIDFQNMILYKYGDLQRAGILIDHWQNNWYNDATVLTIAQYAALPAIIKPFWAPVLASGNIIQQYVRKQSDTYLDTNMFSTLTNSSTLGANLANYLKTGDFISDINNPTTNFGQVSSVDPNGKFIILKNVYGAFQTVGSTVYTITNALYNNDKIIADFNVTVTKINQIISPNELYNWPAISEYYYDPISLYENETNINQQKTFIILLQEQYVQSTVAQIAALFQ